MRLWKKVLIAFGVFLLLLAGAFVTFIGPWPTYTASFEGTSYFKKDIARIDAALRQCKITDKPGKLKVGWGVAKITPPVGTPLAGYSARKGNPSTGVHDDCYVKAVAFSDGEDTAVVVGADMLLVPTNVADEVRASVARQTPLTGRNLFFTASHSHSSVGAFAPGLIARISFGKYDPKIPPMLAQAFTAAVVDAYRSMEPAKLAHGDIDAHEFIHNRTRNAGVDPVLNWMLIEKTESKQRCITTRFSGHATILDDDNMEISAEYPGYFQRQLEKATGATAVYLGGAVCSMSPSAPDAPTAFGKCEAMGNVLAQLVLNASKDPVFIDSADVTSVSVPLDLPPLQMRITPKWRLSPFSRFITGLNATGWMAAVRVGDILFVNIPGELSGEIASTWREWTAPNGIDLWASGFSGDYSGYVSPDRYYGELYNEKGNMAYETGQLSWLGPHMEGFFTALMRHMAEGLGSASQSVPSR